MIKRFYFEVLKCSVVIHHCEYIKSHWIINFKMVSFIVYEFHLTLFLKGAFSNMFKNINVLC
jgi:hypothetical protein